MVIIKHKWAKNDIGSYIIQFLFIMNKFGSRVMYFIKISNDAAISSFDCSLKILFHDAHLHINYFNCHNQWSWKSITICTRDKRNVENCVSSTWPAIKSIHWASDSFLCVGNSRTVPKWQNYPVNWKEENKHVGIGKHAIQQRRGTPGLPEHKINALIYIYKVVHGGKSG